MKKWLFFILFPLIGCTSPSERAPLKRAQLLRMNIHSEMNSLDPRLVRDIPSVTAAKMLFEGLMRMSDKGPQFALAQEVHISEDKRVYTFQLRPARWSDDSPITAHDFAYAWKSLLRPDFPAEYAHQLFVLQNGKEAKAGLVPLDQVGVCALQSDLLEVTLANPNPYFLELVAFPLTFPVKSSLDETNPNWALQQSNDFICNGPFQLLHWHHHSELVALKNPHYWDHHAVQLEKITLTMIEDEHTELNMYENGELDWAGSPNSSTPPEALDALKNSKASELHILPLAGTYCYKFNTQKEPFTSAKIRQAFSLAVHRKALIDNVLQANQLIAEALIPPCMRLAKCRTRAYTPDDALLLFEEGLAEMGYTRESLPSITLIFSRSEKHQKLAQAVQQQWNATFGIKVALQSYEWNSFIERLNGNDFQVGGRGWISDLSDPLSFLALCPDQGNQEFQHLLEAARKEGDRAQRFSLLERAEELLMEECPIAPLYHSTACYLQKPYVHGVYLSKLCDLDFKHAWIK